ncbi:MAG: hypothetical protein WAL34_23850, partial [Acidobacteriaceae bacterium]
MRSGWGGRSRDPPKTAPTTKPSYVSNSGFTAQKSNRRSFRLAMRGVRMTGLVGVRLGGTGRENAGGFGWRCFPALRSGILGSIGAGQLLVHEGKNNRRSFRLAMLSVRMTGLVGVSP